MPDSKVQEQPRSSTSSLSATAAMASPTPRASLSLPRNTLPNAFGLSLLPSPRVSSSNLKQGNSSPLHASPASLSVSLNASPLPSSPAPSKSSLASNGSGIPKFRSLRNMLPFGARQSLTSSPSSPVSNLSGSPPVAFTPGPPAGRKLIKHRRSVSSIPVPVPGSPGSPQSASAISPAQRSGFLTFGARNSFSFARSGSRSPAPPETEGTRSRSEDKGWELEPAISIDAAPVAGEFGELATTSLDDPFQQTIRADGSAVLELDMSGARAGDLSTILESELSSMSISKHRRELR